MCYPFCGLNSTNSLGSSKEVALMYKADLCYFWVDAKKVLIPWSFISRSCKIGLIGGHKICLNMGSKNMFEKSSKIGYLSILPIRPCGLKVKIMTLTFIGQRSFPTILLKTFIQVFLNIFFAPYQTYLGRPK